MSKEEFQSDLEYFKDSAETAAKRFGRITKKYSKKVRDSVFLLRSLDNKEKYHLKHVLPYLTSRDKKALVTMIKQKKARISLKRFGWSFLISGKDLMPLIVARDKKSKDLNEKIKTKFYEARFDEFAERAWSALPQFVAPSIVGQAHIKQAIALQMFSSTPINILVRGDDESSKDKLMKSARRLAPLAFIYTHGQEEPLVTKDDKGLLLKTSNSLISIGELEELNKTNQKMLAKALGSAKCSSSLIATTENMDHELPFSEELAGQFNLIFYMKQVSLTAFKDIAEKIIIDDSQAVKKVDVDFIRRYIGFSKQLDVECPNHLSSKIKDFAMYIKEKESELPYPITPNTVKGLMEMIKASARMELRTVIELKDLDRVFNIFEKATKLNIE